MKKLHRPDLYGWSEFNEERNIDFHSVLWVRPEGGIIIDPLPLSEHDRKHLEELGSVSTIVITNSDHFRDAAHLAEVTGARLLGPSGEKDGGRAYSGFLADGDEVVPGLVVYALNGSKTPGELALVLEDTTLITGDLIRSHQAGQLCLLPPAKLTDIAQANASVARLAALPNIEAVLTGDGWPVFVHGGEALSALVNG